MVYKQQTKGDTAQKIGKAALQISKQLMKRDASIIDIRKSGLADQQEIARFIQNPRDKYVHHYYWTGRFLKRDFFVAKIGLQISPDHSISFSEDFISVPGDCELDIGISVRKDYLTWLLAHAMTIRHMAQTLKIKRICTFNLKGGELEENVLLFLGYQCYTSALYGAYSCYVFDLEARQRKNNSSRDFLPQFNKGQLVRIHRLIQ